MSRRERRVWVVGQRRGWLRWVGWWRVRRVRQLRGGIELRSIQGQDQVVVKVDRLVLRPWADVRRTRTAGPWVPGGRSHADPQSWSRPRFAWGRYHDYPGKVFVRAGQCGGSRSLTTLCRVAAAQDVDGWPDRAIPAGGVHVGCLWGQAPSPENTPNTGELLSQPERSVGVGVLPVPDGRGRPSGAARLRPSVLTLSRR